MAGSSSVAFPAMRDGDQNQMKQHHSAGPSSSSGPSQTPPQQKKKRNQPGIPCKYQTILSRNG